MTTRTEVEKAEKAKYDCEYRDKNRAKRNEWSRAWRKANPEKVKASSRARYKANPERERKRTRAWAKAKPEKVRANHLLKNYGITLEQWNALFASQGSVCGNCHATEPGGSGTWHTDHCHETGVVRGILCADCNTGIGKLGDTIEGLLQAVEYLKRKADKA